MPYRERLISSGPVAADVPQRADQVRGGVMHDKEQHEGKQLEYRMRDGHHLAEDEGPAGSAAADQVAAQPPGLEPAVVGHHRADAEGQHERRENVDAQPDGAGRGDHDHPGGERSGQPGSGRTGWGAAACCAHRAPGPGSRPGSAPPPRSRWAPATRPPSARTRGGRSPGSRRRDQPGRRTRACTAAMSTCARRLTPSRLRPAHIVGYLIEGGTPLRRESRQAFPGAVS